VHDGLRSDRSDEREVQPPQLPGADIERAMILSIAHSRTPQALGPKDHDLAFYQLKILGPGGSTNNERIPYGLTRRHSRIVTRPLDKPFVAGMRTIITNASTTREFTQGRPEFSFVVTGEHDRTRRSTILDNNPLDYVTLDRVVKRIHNAQDSSPAISTTDLP
jgi:hypothetical protein